ncbi:MAG: hypothetical protein FD176_2173 [Rhodospirillaceae bacterium]|nr:MAG: hypothetical protein FD176_2173 [Rhodospirillaceae bacterium]TNC95747.1 MAG: hypothetical protein FD119_2122 [Stygiobacter sp.]
MYDHAAYTRTATRLRRWARRGTWRRMVRASAARRGAEITAIGGVMAAFAHQLQCLSKAMATSNPSR